MRQQLAVERQYRRIHRAWLRLRKAMPTIDHRWKLKSLESEMRALAWVLGVNPDLDQNQDQGNTPHASQAPHSAGYHSGYYAAAQMAREMVTPYGQPSLMGVRLTRARRDLQDAWKGRWRWLLEVPASPGDSPDAQTQYWAAFVSEQCVAELALAMGTALFSSDSKAIHRLIERQDRADTPTVIDLRALIETVEWSVMERQTAGGAA